MKIYNSATHTKEEFVPHEPGKVSMYTCGPTVYHFAHIGNLRSYIMEDVLEKLLRYAGYDVTRVMNITDVGHLASDADTGEDKMLKGAQREHKTVMEIAQFYTDAFFADCKKLNIKYPDVVQPATGMIGDYIKVISSLIAYEALHTDSIEQAVINAVRQLRGAFSLVILSSKNKLIAVRDGFGMRPLCLGRSDHGIAVASESCALDSSNFQFERDVKPGEMIVIEADGSIKSSIVLEENRTAFCLFEYIYFARSDSEIDHLSVYQAHFNMGRQLAREFPVEADMVCGVPDSGLDAAAGYAFESGIPLGSGFTKNRYIGRSFIFPTQTQRDNAVRLKLNPLKANIRGKRLVVVDDSIVRGTTSARTVKMLRDAGAAEVHMRISAPPFTHTCHFGTDIDDESKLIANKMSIEETAKFIGADSLGYISIEGIKQACDGCSLDLCTGCFDGNYPMDIGHHKKSEFEC